jgi:hypothetical protein
MDTTILEVVLGLALVYAALAALVMKLQEEVGGNLLNYRANILHDLLTEATGQDDGLKQRLLQNPLVFALYRNGAARQHWLLRDSGPSAIPPSVFARALLAELNGGAAPALAHANPAAFFGACAPSALLGGAGGRDALGGTPGTAAANSGPTAAATSGVGNLRIWQAMQTLLPGHEQDWPGYEAAIAQWFSDIGDRSDGWFKRKTSRWALALSLLLVVALNVDSFHIASTLASDPALRLGLADLAARVDSQRRSDAAGQPDAPAPASAAAQPMQQLASRMTDAITRLTSAFLGDKAIGNYSTNLAPIQRSCDIVRESSALGHPASVASAPRGKGVVAGGLLTDNAMLGNADIWVRVLPLLQTKVEVAQLLPAETAERTYKLAYECVSQVSAWVRSATAATDNAGVRSQMQEAASALESVKSALLTLVERQQASVSLRRAYLADPEAFATCRDNNRSRSAFDACLQRELRAGLRLPLLWFGGATRAQFCTVASGPAVGGTVQLAQISVTVQLPAPAAAASLAASGTGASASAQVLPAAVQPAARPGGLCAAEPFNGDAGLGLPALQLQALDGWAWLGPVAGWLVSTLFVALGAPFWFDLLSKVVRMRSAGAVRDAAADAQRGSGTQPLPAPNGAGAAAASGSTDTDTPFSDSRNRFEDGLQPVDRLRLQQRLGIDQSGRLDGPTRSAIRAWCAANGVTPVVEELDAPLFLRIVGRPATQTGATSGSARPGAGQAHAAVPALAAALMPVLAQPGRLAPGQTLFDAELRAMAVLFRYRQQRARPGATPRDCRVLQLPRSNPAALDEIDDLLAADIQQAAASGLVYPLEPPCWMDWAIGELGQVENDARSRAGSNARICEYLDTAQANAGDDGDHKPWCGAFVAWVLLKYAAYRAAHVGDAARAGDPLSALAAGDARLAAIAPVATPLLASGWAQWGTAHANWQASAGFGDIVLFRPQGAGSSGHVAFVVDWDASTQTLWALGGNQSRGTRVSMEPWDAAEVVSVMRAP